MSLSLTHKHKNRLTSDKILILRNALTCKEFLKRKKNSEWENMFSSSCQNLSHFCFFGFLWLSNLGKIFVGSFCHKRLKQYLAFAFGINDSQIKYQFNTM